jgi:hypothetical protein
VAEENIGLCRGLGCIARLIGLYIGGLDEPVEGEGSVSVITTFLQSEQALKFLGLPGLALLLAFIFYRTMVANRLIRPISRNQSFIVLVLIIVYFAAVSVLLIWVFRPERGAPPAAAAAAQAQGKIEEPSLWAKVDGFFDRAEMDTPLETFDAAFGPATGDSPIGEGTSQLRKRTYYSQRDGVLVTVGHDDRSVQWIAAFDNAQKLRIPTLNLGFAQDDGSVRRYERLSDFDLGFLAEHCGANAVGGGRGGFLAVTPCYFGRPGSYHNFAFLFMMGGFKSALVDNCSPVALDGSALTAERVRQCKAGKEKPIGFIVAPDEALLPGAIEAFFATLDN